MPVREPGWWYGRAPLDAWPAKALSPVARVWAWAAARRIAKVTPARVSLPVICVGNFTAGGTGKTPLSIEIARLLIAAGERPVFLTRGYGGRVRGPHRVHDGLDTSRDVGDEALLLARHAPVIVSRDRVAGARVVAATEGLSPPTVIVMDDGLQNPALSKDLSIAVVDAHRGLGNGRVIPAGPLRASFEVQLALADAIVVNTPPSPSLAVAEASIAEQFRSCFGGPVLETTVEPHLPNMDLAGVKVVALAGIANPERFYSLLLQMGAEILAKAQFSDHHSFSEHEAKRVLGDAKRLSARILTTEKDWVRLIGATGALADLREQATPVPIHLKLGDADELRLASLVEAAVIKRRKAAFKP